MTRGGTRVGAGRPRGAKNKKTLAKQAEEKATAIKVARALAERRRQEAARTGPFLVSGTNTDQPFPRIFPSTVRSPNARLPIAHRSQNIKNLALSASFNIAVDGSTSFLSNPDTRQRPRPIHQIPQSLLNPIITASEEAADGLDEDVDDLEQESSRSGTLWRDYFARTQEIVKAEVLAYKRPLCYIQGTKWMRRPDSSSILTKSLDPDELLLPDIYLQLAEALMPDGVLGKREKLQCPYCTAFLHSGGENYVSSVRYNC